MASSPRFGFVGGHPALDLFNTVDWRLSDEPGERLGSFADLLAWARQAELIDAAERRALSQAALRRPERAERALREALELRELGHRLVDALLAGRRPGKADLAQWNELSRRHAAPAAIEWSGKGYAWVLDRPAGDPDRLLARLARAVSELLTSPESALIARCQDDRGCGWVFLDRSRSKRRRWCSMSDCGNRAKARRHYRRTTGR